MPSSQNPAPEIINHYPIEMVFVEGGTFKMQGRYDVQLSNFYLGKCPVSQGLWKAVMGKNPAHFKGDKLPVDRVSWDDTQLFLEKLNAQSKYTYSLPSEAQWEYVARGGIHQEDHTYTYAGSNELDEVAWSDYYEGGSYRSTMPPGLKAPNALGLYDMSGNVWEWCQDIYDENFYKSEAAQKPDPINDGKKVATSKRLVRGGSWFIYVYVCRVSCRNGFNPDGRLNDGGFRLSRAS